MSVRATWPGWAVGIIPLEQEQVDEIRFALPPPPTHHPPELATSPQLSFPTGGEGGSESSELQLLERTQVFKNKF